MTSQNLKRLVAASLLACFCLMLALVSGVRAQESRGSLSGTVTDQTGAAIPGAKVTARNNATNASLTVGTSDQGAYQILDLDPGIYTVTVATPGFKTLDRNGVEIRAGVRLGLDLPMQVGAVDQTVTVTAETPLLVTDSGSSSQVLNTDLVGSLPLLGSNIFSLIATTSGNSHVSAFPDHLSERPFDNGGMDGYAINGGPGGGNNNSYLIDGAPNNNNEGLGFVPPPDAVSQVNVMTNEYDAEFGKTGGGITSVSLKTGTNAYHGVVYWNVRNNHLNANLWQNNHVGKPSQVTQWSEPGFEVGGPVNIPHLYKGKDKTFFAVTFEHFFDTVPSSVSRTYPSASALVGNFCSGAPGNNSIGTVILDPLSAEGNPTTSPYRTTTINGNPYTATNANQIDDGCPAGQWGSLIPSNRIDPVMKAIVGHLPGANVSLNGVLCSNPAVSGCSTNFISPNGHGDNYHALTVRVDQNLSSTEKFFASYEDGNRLEFIDNPGGPAGLFPLSNTWRINHGATFNLTSIISPTLISTAKVNWLRHNGLGRSAATGDTPESLGLSSTFKQLFGNDNFPGFGFAGYTGFSQGGTRATSLVDNWTAQETISKVHGNHSIKFGGLITVTTDNNTAVSAIPTISFSNNLTNQPNTVPGSPSGTTTTNTGDAIATALLGYPGTFTYTNPFSASYETRYFDLFAQDDIRVTKKLTLNLGLRWDAQSAPHERFNRAVIGFNPTAISVAAVNNYCIAGATQPASGPGCNAAFANISATYKDQNGNVQPQPGFNTIPNAGTNGGGGSYLGGNVYATPDNRSAYGNDFQNWAPRFGIAYQINKKTVFRGGWGRFFDYAGAYTFPGSLGYTATTAATLTLNNSTGALAGYPVSANVPVLCSQITVCGAANGSAPASLGLSASGYGFFFPDGTADFTPISGSSLGARTGAGTSLTFTDPKFRPDYVNQFNAGFDYELPSRAVFHIEYNGSRTHNAPVSKPIDTITASQFLNYGPQLLGQSVVNPFFNNPLFKGQALFSSPSTTVQQLLLPYPQYTGVTESNIPAGRIWYNSLQARIDKRVSHGLTVVGNFTWSKNIGATSYLNPNYDDPSSLTRQLVSTDVPFIVNIDMTYQLPFFNSSGNRFLRAGLGGWTIAGTAQFSSGKLIGTPGGVVWSGVDPTKVIPGVWNGRSSNFNVASQNRWFNNCVAKFTYTAGKNGAPGTVSGPVLNDGVGNDPQGTCPAGTALANVPWIIEPNNLNFLNNTPPFFNRLRTTTPPLANFAIFKSFAFSERVKFEIRADAYNLTNSPLFGFGDNGAGVQTSATNSAFGSVNAGQGNDPRTIQIAGRLSF